MALRLRMETARRFAETVLSMGAPIRAVEIAEAEQEQEQEQEQRGALIRIVSPSGWTIEVESRADAIALLRELA